MEARDPHLNAIISHIREIEPLAEQLLPTVLAVWRSWIRRLFRALGVVGVFLIVSGIHASR